jgi:predicted dienelactone hydrolase
MLAVAALQPRNWKLKSLILVVGLLTTLFNASSLLARTSSFKFLNSPGPYSVGLKVLDQYDHSRTFPCALEGKSQKEDCTRPLQTLIWYPSRENTATPMTVGDYVRVADTELQFNTPDKKDNRWRSLLKASFNIRLWAVRNAKPATGRYPVLVYAPSDSSVSWENADLCEYLASHGYIVVASPSTGVATRDMTDDLAGISAQANDITFLVTYASSLPDADLSRVAVVGWSWGGGSSLFAAARDKHIDAIASYDGSFRIYKGLVKMAGDVHPESMITPLLFFTAGDPNLLEDIDKYYDGPPSYITGPNVLNAWHGDLLKINMLGMAHPEFSSMFQRRESAKRFAENQVADYGRADANTSYAWVARYTLNFLNDYLKHDAVAVAFLKRTPAENGAPKHFMWAQFRAAPPISASFTKAATKP